MSGTPAAARLDVETVLLCDVLADGTVAGLALVEPVYDTSSGDRVGTRIVNPTTGAAYTPQGTLQPCAGTSTSTEMDHLQQLLCDTAADGTVTQFLRHWTVDNTTGALTAAGDTTLDGLTAYTPAGTVGACSAVKECDSPTTPVATVGLCLADGTPIAVTVQRDCDGVITSQGWINLTTGAYSAGAPPAGTGACGDSQSVQVSGTFCDVDAAGDVVGLVLVEYSYAADGTIDSVRLVDATTGATYTPTGTITVCPAGSEQPEQDAVQLCDTATDGTVTPFLRDYRRDETGAIVGHSDYTLDGAAYTPTGTVGTCESTPCRSLQSVTLCDSTPPTFDASTVTLRVADPASETSANSQYPGHVWQDAGTPAVETVLDGGSATWGQTSGLDDTGDHFVWGGFGFTTPCAPCGSLEDLGDVTLNMSVTVRNDGPNAGVQGDGVFALFNGNTWIGQQAVANNIPAGTTQTLTFTPQTVAVADLPDLVAVLALEIKQGANTQKTWTVSGLTYSLTPVAGSATGTAGCGQTFVRTFVRDCQTGELVETVDSDLAGAPYTPVGTVASCTPQTGCDDEAEPCAKQIVERCGCDDTDGDGAADVTYTELWAVDPCGGTAPELVGTYLDGDLTQPYTPVAPVDCTAADVSEAEPLLLCDSGTPFLRHIRYADDGTPMSVLDTTLDGTTPYTPAGTVGQCTDTVTPRTVTPHGTQNTAWNLAANPGTQSVTLLVYSGTATVTTAEGNLTVPAGATLTWGVDGDSVDSGLTGTLSIAGAAGASWQVLWTTNP
ncbi:hypothetical protein PV518_37625 [Streptomyces sp. ND04-05B]|uniref:hypothetical protein n=1 Tax=Streptomyces sp. ND04-05B TaxID=3028693 RepID=UPI0029BE351E|nr:hypothetical protein [Streptomyces sp. ND04-05B]MDX3067817.1 hypothetical protein [Streptomyces sp. ND04-05B]